MTTFTPLVRRAERMLPLSLFLVLCLAGSGSLSAQLGEPPAEVSRAIGAQIGLLGVWGYAELPLGRSTVARLDIGLDGGWRGGSFHPRNIVALAPVLKAGPRWYYNLSKRATRGKRTGGNAANFLSLPVSYHPGWFTIANVDGTTTAPAITALPTWGIRRNLGKYLNFEVGIGVGYTFQWTEYGYRNSEWTAWIPLRFGF